MTLATEYVVRQELGKQLGGDYRGRFVCVLCLGPLVRAALGTNYTRGQVERALRAVSKSPGSLRQRHVFLCDKCGKIASCLGGAPGPS
jgi:hypothetical protein